MIIPADFQVCDVGGVKGQGIYSIYSRFFAMRLCLNCPQDLLKASTQGFDLILPFIHRNCAKSYGPFLGWARQVLLDFQGEKHEEFYFLEKVVNF